MNRIWQRVDIIVLSGVFAAVYGAWTLALPGVLETRAAYDFLDWLNPSAVSIAIMTVGLAQLAALSIGCRRGVRATTFLLAWHWMAFTIGAVEHDWRGYVWLFHLYAACISVAAYARS